MIRIHLGRGYYALIDDEDYERCSKYSWTAKVKVRGGVVKQVYAHTNVRSDATSNGWSTTTLHRFIMGVDDSRIIVDHVNRNGLDCRRSNLRVATNSQNAANSQRRSDNASGFKGIYWRERDHAWIAQIGTTDGHKHIGSFKQREDAARAYDEAAKRYFGEFAYTNEVMLAGE